MGSGRRSTIVDDYSFSDSKPTRPTAPKPKFTPKPSTSQLKKDQAIALYTFDADQPGDLGFKKGEVITITKRTESPTDWWTGRIGDGTGVFPRHDFSLNDPTQQKTDKSEVIMLIYMTDFYNTFLIQIDEGIQKI